MGWPKNKIEVENLNSSGYKRVFLAGTFNTNSLERSYSSNASKLNLDVFEYDLISGINKYTKGAVIGRTIQRFLPLDPWLKKMNRDLIIKAIDFQPDVFIYFTTGKVLFGTLATLKVIFPHLKIVWVWPDTPLNLQEHNFSNGQLVDLTATYSSSSINVLTQLGFKNVTWIPLAGDSLLHQKEINNQNRKCDISFVGRWDVKRERVMTLISNNFRDLNIEVHGPLWKTQVKDKTLKNNIKGTGFYGEALANTFNTSRINMNIIDDTNFPAANMRFFEIPIAGGLEVTSACPEMESEFINKQHVIYYKNDLELLENIQWVLDNSEKCAMIQKNAQDLILFRHTYLQRIQTIFQNI